MLENTLLEAWNFLLILKSIIFFQLKVRFYFELKIKDMVPIYSLLF